MGILFIESFDGIGTTAATGFPRKGWGYSGATLSTSGRNGNGCYMGSNAAISKDWQTNNSKIWTGFALNPGSSFVLSFSYFGNYQLTLQIDTTSRCFKMYRGWLSTLLATGTHPVNAGTWYYIEVYAYIHGTAGEFEVRINGVQDLLVTGANTKGYATNAYISRFHMYCSTTYVDDIYCLDENTGLTDFQGDSRIYAYNPTGDGAHLDFTPNSGATNYTQVDETSSDDDATYVSSGTPGAYDLYNFASLPSGQGPIVAAQLTSYARKDDLAARVLQHKIKSGSTTANGANTKTMGASYQGMWDIWETDPNTGAAWTRDNINAAQFGPLVNT